ncbi:ATP-dependent helicase [Treponema parvum]|uniref:ATP-dependent helicase n=1 Tax=Treponema parvum TaxID=138851 RepID=UPI001AEC6D6C|nr:UvrD-helicase domain-containing protein [Treponema parvum]QTQ16938.1 UvrD-helicase domain-containing protein [Treponema parvum]
MSFETYLSVLNPQQREAVEHSGSPLLILAGAGSGKTRVITTKIAYLISQRNIDARNILAVTFTKKAAREMAERAVRLEPMAAGAQIRTFHSFGAWFLRRFADRAGVDRNFTVYDDDDMVTLVSKAVPKLNRQSAAKAAHKIALAKDYCLTPDSKELIDVESSAEFPAIYAAYEERLRSTGNVDFGDLIMLPVTVLQNDENIRRQIQYRFKVIMVDEYQDSNVAQFKFLEALSGVQDNNLAYLCVVGDDDQSIYRFRGAEVQNILNFQNHFPGTNLIRLEQNYRSTVQILAVADKVVKKNESRLGKTLKADRGDGSKPILVFCPTQDDETQFCANLIKEAKKKGCPYGEWAVLYRTNAQSLGFESEFLRHKIPYVVVGSLKFYEREEIKDILAFLALTANPRDEIDFRRVVNKPSRGIGEKSQEIIIARARANAASAQAALTPEAAVNSEQAAAPEPSVHEGGSGGQNAAEIEGSDSSSQSGARANRAAGDSTAAGLIEAAREIANGTDGSDGISKKAKEGLSDFVKMMDLFSDFAGMKSVDPEPDKEDSENEKKENAFDAAEKEIDEASKGIAVSSNGALPHKKKTEKLSTLIEKIAERSGILDYHKNHDEISGTQRAANIQELINNAVLYPCSREGLLDFLDTIELDRSLDEASNSNTEQTDCVTLITLHNTKGLEFHRVIITGLENGIFPREDKTGADLEEERRLFYVGITRAQDQLYITSCSVRRLYGRVEYMQPSRFLLEAGSSLFQVLGDVPPSYAAAMRSQGDVSPLQGLQGEEKFTEVGIGDAFSAWKKGCKIYHDDYGYGQIINTFSRSGEYVVTVMFEGGGIKQFIPKYQSHNMMIVKD